MCILTVHTNNINNELWVKYKPYNAATELYHIKVMVESIFMSGRCQVLSEICQADRPYNPYMSYIPCSCWQIQSTTFLKRYKIALKLYFTYTCIVVMVYLV